MKAKKSESKFSPEKISLLKRGLLAAVLVILMFMAFSATASAAVIDVPSAGNETIQQAINNATAGDTILVNATAYNVQGTPETVIVDKSDIIIRSVNGRAVVSAGGASDDVFNITDQTNVTLDGFEIRDAHGTSQDVAGIYMKNANECNISDNTVTNISAAGNHDARGIYLSSSSNNTFSSSTSVYNLSAYHAYGIYLSSSSNNTFNSSTSVYNLSANSEARGIYLSSSNNNTFSTSTSVYNLSAYDAYGIRLYSSSDNSFDTSTVYNLSANSEARGICLSSSNNNTFSTSTSVYNLSAYHAYGIRLYSSSNNRFSSGSISDINAPNWWDFYSDENAHRNSAENITISSYPTTISFTYDNGVGIKSVETPPLDPALKSNIGKYVSATNVTASSWLSLNVSYENGDVPAGMQESTLRMWRYNGTWQEVEGSGVNTTGNYVYANITEFSIFAPLGNDPAVTVIPTATGTGNVTITTSSGYFCNETAALGAAEFPDLPDSAVTFPHGFFNVTICGLNADNPETVTINFTFPSAIPTNAEFWKYNSSNETWYPYPFDSNDGDNVISITITDNNATGDHNPVLGVINDPNGIGWPAAAEVPALTPIGLIALIGLLLVIAAMSMKIKRRK